MISGCRRTASRSIALTAGMLGVGAGSLVSIGCNPTPGIGCGFAAVPVEVWVVDLQDGSSVRGASVEPEHKFEEAPERLVTDNEGKATFFTAAGYEVRISKFSQRRKWNWGRSRVTVSRAGYEAATASVPGGEATSSFGSAKPKENMIVVLRKKAESASAGGN